MKRTGFTLIELLIVVAVVAILAAIAVPNFLAAQSRAKVTRARSDMRTLATALEAYAVDSNGYPPGAGVGPYAAIPWSLPVSQRLIPLTTPTAYLNSVPRDPYRPTHVYGGLLVVYYDTYDYVDAMHHHGTGSQLTSGGAWRVCSAGPDLGIAFGGVQAGPSPNNPAGVDYDPTNGSESMGDLVRVSATASTSTGGPDDLSNPNRPGILRTPFYREQWL